MSPPRSVGLSATGEGGHTVSSMHSVCEVADPNPSGRSTMEEAEAERPVRTQKLRNTKIQFGTWNVRSMNTGKLEVVKREMTRCDIDILGVSELRWSGMGKFNSDNHTVYFCGENNRKNGVGFICSKQTNKCILGFNPVNDRIISIRMQCKPVNITVINIYAPTSTADEEKVEEFYSKVQEAVDEIPKGDMLFILVDWNAKVGNTKTQGVTGSFGLGRRNERGEQLIDFCNYNHLAIMNTLFKLPPRRLYTWKAPDGITRNQIDYILCQQRWRSSILCANTRPGADCGSDHNLLTATMKFKIKTIHKTFQQTSYDLEKINDDFKIELKNRFELLYHQEHDSTSDEFWNSVKFTVTQVADRFIAKRTRKKVTPWLSEAAIEIAEKRRSAKIKRNDNLYRQLNYEFQKQARKDKEDNLRDTCKRLEKLSECGKTRDFFKEIKNITGTFDPKCSTVNSETGKACTDRNAVKDRWKEYTDSLYARDPNVNDTFSTPEYTNEPEILEAEVHYALHSLSNGKSAGCDNIPVELMKAGDDKSVKTLTILCNKVWYEKTWPNDWKKAIYVPIFKKGDKKACSNYRTISLISHTSKVLLKVIQKRLERFLVDELPNKQAGFKIGSGTRDHIFNIRTIMEKYREYKKPIYLCFIDYSKAFDCVDHERLWCTLHQMGTPTHLIVLLQQLYDQQVATVRTEYGETDPIVIGKGVRQGCILSPLLFNIYTERIMREVLDNCGMGVSVGGRMINNLRYADDTTLLAESEAELLTILRRLKDESAKAGLYLNVSKTKILTTGPIRDVRINNEPIEVVDTFSFLGSMISNTGYCEQEIRRRIALGKSAMKKLDKIWKDRGISKETKKKLVKVLVFPVAMYGSETWTIRKADRKRIDSFELWCWRHLLKISWTSRKTNAWVLENINPGDSLEAMIARGRLRYFGHVCRALGSMEREIMFGYVKGQRGRGRPRTRWLDGVLEVSNRNLAQTVRLTEDRSGWRLFHMRVTRGRTRLDGTR